MFLGSQDEMANHPMNTRIHNPYQYIFTCDSLTLLNATRMALKKFKNIENKLMEHLADDGKYNVSVCYI